MEHVETLSHSQAQTLVTNRLIRNTYTLLALTLAFSAAMAGVSMVTSVPPVSLWVFLAGFYGLLFLTTKFRNSSMGIVCVFAFTGFMGFTLGPILSLRLAEQNGPQVVMQALGGTAFIFFALSAYAFISRKDFSFMGSFLFAGLLVAFLSGLAALFVGIPTLHLAVSAAFILLSSGVILYQTSAIIHGVETNYIMATVTLYVALYNIFIGLLNLLSALNGNK